MKLSNDFTVAAPLERTWETLLNVERVAGCLPGASIEPVGEDGMYRGSMRIKVGPVTIAYSGTVRLADVDTDQHVASFEARATETKGAGTAAAVIRNRVEPAGDGTHVVVETDLNVTGRAAQFGRGLMEDVASKMLADFAGRLEQLVLEGASATQATSATEAGARAEPAPAPEDASLDVGGVLLRGYCARLAVGGGLLALLLLVVFARRRERRTIMLRFRL
jgi:carbon monoxide dehydrogenase subunit G